MWNVGFGFSMQAAADWFEWRAEKSEYSAPRPPTPPACSLFMLTHKWIFQNTKQAWGMHPPIQKKQQDKDIQIICQAPGHKRSPESRKFPKKSCRNILDWQSDGGTSINCTITPPSRPPWLSCMQIGLNIVVPHRRAVGTGFANMSRVREGIKKTNAWKEEGVISAKAQFSYKKTSSLWCRDTRIWGFSYLFSVESRQREERWARLPKIQSVDETVKWLRGNWTRSPCSQDQAGVLCHNKGRREGERKKEWREREREGGRGPTTLRAQTIGGGLASFFFLFCSENRGRGKKRRGSGYRETGWKEGGGESRFWESPSLWHLVMKGPVENAHYLFFPLFLSASNIVSKMTQACSIQARNT